MLWILVVVLLLASVGGFPAWGWHGYGYWPSGVSAVLMVVVVVLLLRGGL